MRKFFVLLFLAGIIFGTSAADYKDMFSRAMNGEESFADSLRVYAAIDSSGVAADYYAEILSSSASPFKNDGLFEEWVAEWHEQTEAKARMGSVNACLSLGRALIGDFMSLRPKIDDYDFEKEYECKEKGLSYMVQAAMYGEPTAQYLYAVLNDKLTKSESELWIGMAAENGQANAITHIAKLELDKGNYDKSISLLAHVPDDYVVLDGDDIITAQTIRLMANFLKKNPDYCLTGFGPVKDDKSTFYYPYDEEIIACATYKGMAGLLKLNMNGEQIKHNGIPFKYDYIVPFKPKHHSFVPLFQVSPYSYEIEYIDSYIRILDKSGNEVYCHLYVPFYPTIDLSDDYVFDQSDTK